MSSGSNPQAKVFLILWFAFLQCVVFYGVIVFLVKTPEKKLPFDEISFIAIAASLAAVPHLIGTIYQLRNNLSVGLYVIKVALAESAALFGFVMHFLFGCRELTLKAIAISAVSIIFLFPMRYLKKKEPEDPTRPPPIG